MRPFLALDTPLNYSPRFSFSFSFLFYFSASQQCGLSFFSISGDMSGSIRWPSSSSSNPSFKNGLQSQPVFLLVSLACASAPCISLKYAKQVPICYSCPKFRLVIWYISNIEKYVIQVLCMLHTSEFISYFYYHRSLRFEDKPQYSYLKMHSMTYLLQEGKDHKWDFYLFVFKYFVISIISCFLLPFLFCVF